MLRANKAKRDKIKTIDLKMTPRFLASDISIKETGNLLRQKQFKEVDIFLNLARLR